MTDAKRMDMARLGSGLNPSTKKTRKGEFLDEMHVERRSEAAVGNVPI